MKFQPYLSLFKMSQDSLRQWCWWGRRGSDCIRKSCNFQDENGIESWSREGLMPRNISILMKHHGSFTNFQNAGARENRSWNQEAVKAGGKQNVRWLSRKGDYSFLLRFANHCSYLIIVHFPCRCLAMSTWPRGHSCAPSAPESSK